MIQVELVLDDPAGWFAPWRRGVLAYRGPAGVLEREFELGTEGRASLVLPVGKLHHDAFESIRIGPWSVRVAAIGALVADRVGIQLEPVPGARFEWDPRASGEERGRVEVVAGGFDSPGLATQFVTGEGVIRADSLPLDALPFMAPRPHGPHPVWLRSPGHLWRRFELRPSTDVVRVRMSPAASVRVLHDGPPEVGLILAHHHDGRSIVEVDGAGPVTLRDCAPGPVRVEVANPSDGVLRAATVEAIASETVEVDLGARAASSTLGRLRVRVLPPPGEAGEEGSRLSLEIWRRTGGASVGWRPAGVIGRQPGDERNGQVVFGPEALEPGEYLLVLQPVLDREVVTVRAGATADVRIAREPLGRLSVELPDGLAGADAAFSVSTAEPDARERARTGSARWHSVPTEPIDLAPGRYIARVETSGARYDSAPVDVVSGAITAAVLRRVEETRLRLRAVSAATGEPVDPGEAFWLGCRFEDAATGRAIETRLAYSAFDARGRAVPTVRFSDEHERIRVLLPEAEAHRFDPVAEIDPTETDAVEIVARPR